jgi:PIN domain nuclease of toxin-antitoxin system
MIVLDTHIWFWWVGGEHERLSADLLDALADAPRVAVAAVSCLELDGRLASVDRQFVSYPELAGRLLA